MIKPLVTEHMAEMTKIVSYFEFENKNNETTFDIDEKGNLSMSKKIAINSEMEKTIFNLISSMPITVEVRKGYMAFNRNRLYSLRHWNNQLNCLRIPRYGKC